MWIIDSCGGGGGGKRHFVCHVDTPNGSWAHTDAPCKKLPLRSHDEFRYPPSFNHSRLQTADSVEAYTAVFVRKDHGTVKLRRTRKPSVIGIWPPLLLIIRDQSGSSAARPDECPRLLGMSTITMRVRVDHVLTESYMVVSPKRQSPPKTPMFSGA